MDKTWNCINADLESTWRSQITIYTEPSEYPQKWLTCWFLHLRFDLSPPDSWNTDRWGNPWSDWYVAHPTPTCDTLRVKRRASYLYVERENPCGLQFNHVSRTMIDRCENFQEKSYLSYWVIGIFTKRNFEQNIPFYLFQWK